MRLERPPARIAAVSICVYLLLKFSSFFAIYTIIMRSAIFVMIRIVCGIGRPKAIPVFLEKGRYFTARYLVDWSRRINNRVRIRVCVVFFFMSIMKHKS